MSKRTRLDRYISRYTKYNQRDVKRLLAQKRISVDGDLIADVDVLVDEFSLVCVDGENLPKKVPRYIMLHKPKGVVSATKDALHTTVIDLLEGETQDLHIVGRLDLNTTGLLLLTNDSRWSERLMLPNAKVVKSYLVTLQNPIDESYKVAFSEGMYFSYEKQMTLPAGLEIISAHKARVTLTEGRYHQVKRMFGRFRNPVVELHRERVGALMLSNDLGVGNSRDLTTDETLGIFQ